jgi:hypothetical protein
LLSALPLAIAAAFTADALNNKAMASNPKTMLPGYLVTQLGQL